MSVLAATPKRRLECPLKDVEPGNELNREIELT